LSSSSDSLSDVSEVESSSSEELSSENLELTEFEEEKLEIEEGAGEGVRKGEVEVEGKLKVLNRKACAVSIERRDRGGDEVVEMERVGLEDF
jgi:hypothetical protein